MFLLVGDGPWHLFYYFAEGFLYVRLSMLLLETRAQKVDKRNPVTVTKLTDCHKAVSEKP